MMPCGSVVLTHAEWIQAPTLPLPSGVSPAKKLPSPALSELSKRDVGGITKAVLDQAAKLGNGTVDGPETAALDPQGRLYMFDRFGWLYRSEKLPAAAGPGFSEPEPLVFVGPGRPLGAHFDANGDLIICNSLKGLTKLRMADLSEEILSAIVSADSPIDPSLVVTFADDLDIAADGRIFFSMAAALPPPRVASGEYDTLYASTLNLLEGTASGRLLVYDPRDRSTRVLAGGIWFANGIALSKDEAFVVIVETGTRALQRFWLKGEKAGQLEVFVDDLPGIPDGVHRDPSDGTFWVALLTEGLSWPLRRIIMPSRMLRAAVGWLPDALRPKPSPTSRALQVAEDGALLLMLTAPDHAATKPESVSSVVPTPDALLIGSLREHGIYVLPRSLAVADAAAAA